ncbi:ribulose-phosphate 3-epimerase [Lactobacillus sp. ESL0679]|uniref:ribulose-phosphate 3-epimerase n=1 Tax=Lactobacillus sp. ESL0679 TaxID=2983209 RepID=UPI0023F79FA7|nr:ribulose-phosphate 3-epimerase [Lactobacillus sp. ESL0679]MDF7683305.1 ribulose-phosphate 3-epimerase [Lactobacillus sp. ESL0679]
MAEILPSIFGADILNLQCEIDQIEKENIKLLHVDVMDGNFVSNIAFGPNQVKAMKDYSNLTFDIHTMVADPLRHIEDIINTGAEMICVHFESTPQIHYVLQKIKKAGKKAGVALAPGTSEAEIKYLLNEVDYVLVMSINPGEPGQTFLPQTIEKIKNVKKMIGNRNIQIEVDGGITDTWAKACRDAGADLLVVGGYLFGKEQFHLQYQKLLDAIK